MDSQKREKADLDFDLENVEKDHVTGIKNADLRENNNKPVTVKRKKASSGKGSTTRK